MQYVDPRERAAREQLSLSSMLGLLWVVLLMAGLILALSPDSDSFTVALGWIVTGTTALALAQAVTSGIRSTVVLRRFPRR